MCEDLLERAVQPLDAVLQQANITLDQSTWANAGLACMMEWTGSGLTGAAGFSCHACTPFSPHFPPSSSPYTTYTVAAFEVIGGGVRVPKVQSVLREKLKGTKLDLSMHLNGDEAMAQGASFYAANISTRFKVGTCLCGCILEGMGDGGFVLSLGLPA